MRNAFVPVLAPCVIRTHESRRFRRS